MTELYTMFGFVSLVVLMLVFCTTSLAAFYWWYSKQESTRCYNNITGIEMFPIVSYWKWLREIFRRKYPRSYILQLLHGVCKLRGSEGISMFWLGLKPIVIFYKAETVEVLLNNSVTISKGPEYDYLKSWLGTGLITSDGEKWRTHRKLLTPTFHFQILDHYVSVFENQASILVKKLEMAVGKPWIDVCPLITMCTLDIVCQTMMGVQLDAQSEGCREYVKAINEMSDLFIYRIFRPWLWLDTLYFLSPSGRKFQQNVKRIHDFTMKVIKGKKETMILQGLEGNNEETVLTRKKTFLELLLELHLKDSSFTEEHVREEVDTFMFAGHDTTAMSVCWTLYELGRHPEIQEKVFEEIKSVFKEDTERPITIDDLKQMKYMMCVIKESLRLNPSVPVITKQLKKDLKFGKFTLKPGCTCVVPAIALHMDPEQFPVPFRFNPDRFLHENKIKRHPYAYIPFSAGPRNCIGQRFAMMEMKTILTHVLRRFKITSLDPHDRLEKEIGMVLKNAEPLRFKFELRNSGTPTDP